MKKLPILEDDEIQYGFLWNSEIWDQNDEARNLFQYSFKNYPQNYTKNPVDTSPGIHQVIPLVFFFCVSSMIYSIDSLTNSLRDFSVSLYRDS